MINPSDQDHLRWLQHAKLDSFKGLSVLDLGCGSGYLCQKAKADNAATVVGIDVVKPQDLPQILNGWQFFEKDLNDKAWQKNLPGNGFDLILAFDIIEHLDSPYLFLKSCREALKNGGRVVLTTPNIFSWERLYNPRSWSGAKDPQHKTLFTKYSLNFLLERSGFSKASFQAPMRSLSFLGPLQPQIGGQVFCIAQP